MAIDLSKLPPEAPVPNTPPSRLLWMAVFLVLTLAGVLAVLMLWPAGESTHTWWFWCCVTVYPMGIAMFIVSRRYSVYEDRRLDAMAWNDARKRYIQQSFDQESIPVFVLGAALRITEEDQPNTVQQITSGALKFDAQASPHEANESISARWFRPLDARLAAGEAERHVFVLEWVYDRLLGDLAQALAKLPAELPVRIVLDVSGYLGNVDPFALWTARWNAHQRRAATCSRTLDAMDLMAIDAWLDDQKGLLRQKGAFLFVSASLGRVLDAYPVDGSAEAGIALLMVSNSTVKRYKLHPIAAIHRPMRAANENMDHAMTYALQWGRADQGLACMWMTGFDGESVGPLHVALSQTNAAVQHGDALAEFDLDRTVGNAGPAAGWLAVACAAQNMAQAAMPQLIAQYGADHTILAVVAACDLDESNEARRST